MCRVADRNINEHPRHTRSTIPPPPPLPSHQSTDRTETKNQVHLQGESAAAYCRPDGTVHCVPRTLSPPEYRTLDLPRINYSYNGLKYSYVYTCRFTGSAGNSERVSEEGVGEALYG